MPSFGSLCALGVVAGKCACCLPRTSNRGGGPVMWRVTEKGSESHVSGERERGIAALRCGGQGRCSDKCWIGIAVLASSLQRVDRRCGSFLRCLFGCPWSRSSGEIENARLGRVARYRRVGKARSRVHGTSDGSCTVQVSSCRVLLKLVLMLV